jgi:hypothetical protein
MPILEYFKRNRRITYPLAAVIGMLVMYISSRWDYQLTQNVRSVELYAAVLNAVEFRRILIVWTAPDSTEWRFVLSGASRPPIDPDALASGLDSIAKASGSDSMALLREGVWYQYRIWEPPADEADGR